MFNSKNRFELSPRLKLGIGRTYTQNNILKIGAFLALFLAVGLAFNAVRLVFNSGNQATDGSGAGPSVLGASDTRPQDQNVEFIDYQVQKGDTLFNLAQKFNIGWSTLATLNNLKSPYTLKPGQNLKVPKQ